MAEPEVFLYDVSDSEAEAALDLGRQLKQIGIEAPLVLSSPHGAPYVEALTAVGAPADPRGADQDRAMALGSEAKRAGADAIVAIGGGRVLDVGKLAAARAGLQIVVVPTQLSHDGLCSPVAVVPDDAGKSQSLGAIEPRAVYLSLPTLMKAPARSVGAGIGDLLANPMALRDWTLAAEHGLDEIDTRAWDLSAEAFSMIEEHLDVPPARSAADPGFVKLLGQALIFSGLAMIHAGTSRPASGGEHEISHAIDQLYGGRGWHGEQVAFGCIVSAALYDEDVPALTARLGLLGLPSHPSDLDLSEDDLLAVLLEAPETRPGRFTIIEDADLDEASARALIRRIWP